MGLPQPHVAFYLNTWYISDSYRTGRVPDEPIKVLDRFSRMLPCSWNSERKEFALSALGTNSVLLELAPFHTGDFVQE